MRWKKRVRQIDARREFYYYAYKHNRFDSPRNLVKERGKPLR